jgi:hypothetical protein
MKKLIMLLLVSLLVHNARSAQAGREVHLELDFTERRLGVDRLFLVHPAPHLVIQDATQPNGWNYVPSVYESVFRDLGCKELKYFKVKQWPDYERGVQAFLAVKNYVFGRQDRYPEAEFQYLKLHPREVLSKFFLGNIQIPISDLDLLSLRLSAIGGQPVKTLGFIYYSFVERVICTADEDLLMEKAFSTAAETQAKLVDYIEGGSGDLAEGLSGGQSMGPKVGENYSRFGDFLVGLGRKILRNYGMRPAKKVPIPSPALKSPMGSYFIVKEQDGTSWYSE